ncbi:RNHCP domain-containing protein [Nonomuraea salmonea]|uniref:RNHCP domain-containing protein n=1 Tax=Nonomuraea salmonea TaxID=46181 RepID=UPI0031E9CBBB
MLRDFEDHSGKEYPGCPPTAIHHCSTPSPAYAAASRSPRTPPDGTRRNHCPSCLHSLHLQDECRSRMIPISIAVLRTGEWMIIHRCTRCGELTSNPICGDDNQLILMRMAVRPLAQPPFPLEAFGDL